jgi:hypothetical protein
MNVLYLGKYTDRFRDIIEILDQKDLTIVELCFGDIYIAQHCKNTGKRWMGYDINPSFVDFAVRKGYNAGIVDLFSLESLPSADVCIIAGSLYHFHHHIDALMRLMLSSSKKIVISEPIKNITSTRGIVGSLAACASNAGKGNENFRYTRGTLLNMLDLYRKRYNFNYTVISEAKDLLLQITHD